MARTINCRRSGRAIKRMGDSPGEGARREEDAAAEGAPLEEDDAPLEARRAENQEAGPSSTRSSESWCPRDDSPAASGSCEMPAAAAEFEETGSLVRFCRKNEASSAGVGSTEALPNRLFNVLEEPDDDAGARSVVSAPAPAAPWPSKWSAIACATSPCDWERSVAATARSTPVTEATCSAAICALCQQTMEWGAVQNLPS